MGFIHNTEDKRFGGFELETRRESFKVYGPRMHAHMNGEHGGVVEVEYRDLDALLEILALVKSKQETSARLSGPPLFSVREAMRDAGVPDWEMGKGVSSADAIRLLAEQRDEARRDVVHLVSLTWQGDGWPSLREHAERTYPGEGERLFASVIDFAASMELAIRRKAWTNARADEDHHSFICSVCERWTTYGEGAADDMPEACDTCWCEAHGHQRKR